MRSLQIRTRTGALSLLASLAGCASTAEVPDLRAPDVEPAVTYYAGDPIGGPLGRERAFELELDPGEARAVRGLLYLVDELPGERYDPINNHIRMIVAEGGAEPLAPGSLLTPGTRLALGEDARQLARETSELDATRAVLVAEYEGLVLPGVATSMVAAHSELMEVAGHRPSERIVRVELWREDTQTEELSIAVIFSDLIETVEGLAEAVPELALRPRVEKLVLDARLGVGRQVAFYAPTRPDLGVDFAYVFVLETDPAPETQESTSALAERVAGIREEVRRVSEEGENLRQRFAQSDRMRLRRIRAIEALDDPDHRRAALVELCTDSGAEVAAEVALMAADSVVDDAAARLQSESEVLRELAGEQEVFAWHLERLAIEMFVEALGRGELPPEYESMLLRHAGEAGRLPGVLEDALAASSSLRGFRARLLEENRIALEDSSPGARVRAYDWLTGQGIEIPGYDPLASRRERREALRVWIDAQLAEEAAAEAKAVADERPDDTRENGAESPAGDGSDAEDDR